MQLITQFAIAGLFLLSGLSFVTALPQPVDDVLAKKATTTAKTTSTTSSYPTPDVPIGAGGGAFATRQGRMFQIQSKTQFFAGIPSQRLREKHAQLIFGKVRIRGGLVISKATLMLIMSLPI